MDSGRFQTQQRMAWENFGIAFGAILVNEMEGMEWVTVIEGQKNIPPCSLCVRIWCWTLPHWCGDKLKRDFPAT